MAILALDTTGAACSVALRVPGLPDRILSEMIGKGHAERLAPMVQTVLAEAGVEPSSLERIGVTIGPGGFAGTRVGVAFARGLALATGAQAFGVSNLAVLAAAHADVRPLATVHDAKRGEVVIQTWGDVPSEPERLSLELARDRLGGMVLCGGGAGLLAEGGQSVLGDGELDLSCLLDLTGSAGSEDSPPAPFYVRPPDAKLPGGIDP